VIGVSLGEDADTVRGFARKLDIPFPLLLDKGGDSPRLFGLWGHPNTVVIDRQGKVIGLVRGERDWQSEPARRLVEELLQEGTSGRLERRHIVAGHEDPKAAAPVPIATILAAPEAFEGQKVTVCGTVVKAKRDVFPNGRPYHTLSVGVGETVLTVFSWSPPSAKAGDRVEAMGVFYVWRYNIRHMIDAAQIRRLELIR